MIIENIIVKDHRKIRHKLNTIFYLSSDAADFDCTELKKFLTQNSFRIIVHDKNFSYELFYPNAFVPVSFILNKNEKSVADVAFLILKINNLIGKEI